MNYQEEVEAAAWNNVEAASENFSIKLEYAERWLTGHKASFPELYNWAEKYREITAANSANEVGSNNA